MEKTAKKGAETAGAKGAKPTEAKNEKVTEAKKMDDKVAKAKETLEKVHSGGSKFRREFIEFINRGSVVDLAVGVAVGGAFTTIVNSLVNDIVMPIVGLLLGGVDFTTLAIRIPNFFGTADEAVIAYGNFLQNVVQFLIIAWVIFMLIKIMNRINRRKDRKEAKDQAAVIEKAVAAEAKAKK